MKLIKNGNMQILTADKGKYIREINDEYKKEVTDEEKEIEYIPYYFTKAYFPKNITLEKIKKLYVEEEISAE